MLEGHIAPLPRVLEQIVKLRSVLVCVTKSASFLVPRGAFYQQSHQQVFFFLTSSSCVRALLLSLRNSRFEGTNLLNRMRGCRLVAWAATQRLHKNASQRPPRNIHSHTAALMATHLDRDVDLSLPSLTAGAQF